MFTIGAAQVVKVDLDGHRLSLHRDGKQVADLPMSAGTGGEKRFWRGHGGPDVEGGHDQHALRETVGPVGDAYDKMVDYSMRLTWSGMYAHAAPWNAGFFGRANRSSGCLGMSDGDASALYGQVRVGDPFEMTGAGGQGHGRRGQRVRRVERLVDGLAGQERPEVTRWRPSGPLTPSIRWTSSTTRPASADLLLARHGPGSSPVPLREK